MEPGFATCELVTGSRCECVKHEIKRPRGDNGGVVDLLTADLVHLFRKLLVECGEVTTVDERPFFFYP